MNRTAQKIATEAAATETPATQVTATQVTATQVSATPTSTGSSSPPVDVVAAIRAAKRTLRAQIGDYAAAFSVVEERMKVAVDEVVTARDAGEDVWPIIAVDDVVRGTVPVEQVDAVRSRGCAVVKQTFDRARAEAWDAQLVDYLEVNDFASTYEYTDDGVFGGLAAGKPSIFPIYWSTPQMEAREDPNMSAVRGFLNGFWKHESQGRTWFDPSRDTAYPDRVRRRAPGASSSGLSAHTDSGSIERWLLPAY